MIAVVGGGAADEKRGFDGFVGDEEDGSRGSGTEGSGTDAGVEGTETACSEEAGGRLETSLESIEGIESEVDGEACKGAGLFE